MRPIIHKATAALLFAVGLTSVAVGQSFNIDLDVLSAPPALGGGAPSPGFGAAAGQTGFWNPVGFANGVPYILNDLNGQGTSVSVTLHLTNLSGGGGYLFPGNTGDYALLLNDAKQVGPLIDGGTLTYTFRGLAPGEYEVYTYAASPLGLFVATPVVIPEAIKSQLQTATGPMPGNAFQYLVTHTIHQLDLAAPGTFHVSITQPPQHHTAMFVNGFQIVMVPEPSSALGVVFGTAILLFRFNKSRRRREGYGFGYGEV